MEAAEVLPKRRGRKRKRIDGPDATMDCNGKKKTVETRSLRLVGRYVIKEFENNGIFLGKITFYESGLYGINYEDGDSEDLYPGEVKAFLVEEGDLVGEWFERKEKLDKFLLEQEVKALEVKSTLEQVRVNQVDSSLPSQLNNVEASANEMVGDQDDVKGDSNTDANADSSSDSCEDAQEMESNLDTLIPPPELPLSSGHIGVPEEYVSHLLSVYSFLRSFSIPLFLYPFGLDDFVGALNCALANTLLDSVHIALLHVLKRNLERLSSEGSELALKCLRSLDWSLLDTLTWPVYVVHFLTVMSSANAPQLKGFYAHFLRRDYYTLSAGKKLIILQILCDHVLDSEELRAEMDMREELEVGIDTDSSTVFTTAGESRRFHPRYSKTSATKNIGAMQGAAEHYQMKPSLGDHSNQTGGPVGSSSSEDSNGDECRICGMEGLLICCDGCPSSYHTRCLGLNKIHMPEGTWYCPECKINATQPKILQGTALKGGQCIGVDPYGQVFVTTCDHLLILEASVNSEACLRYYNRHDVPKVLRSLYSNVEHVLIYSEICRGIMQYWELPESTLPCYGMSEVDMRIENESRGSKYSPHLDSLLGKSVVENSGSCAAGIGAANIANSSLRYGVQEPVLSGSSLETGTISDQLTIIDSTRLNSCSILSTVMPEPSSLRRLPGQAADTNELSQQSTSSVNGITSFSGRNGNIDHSCVVNGHSQESKASDSCLDNRVVKLSCQGPYDGCSYTGSSFKPAGYINNYAHGDFAASAASNLALLSFEENPASESRPCNRRKVMLDNVSLQVKAFSSVAMRFFWPNTEKKLFEVPRERCSWCFSCKALVSSKRGCLLNAAASNATRGAVKLPAGVRLMKNGDGRLAGIAAYIIFMEQNLSGLVGGPFLNDTFRKRWRKLVEQATTCNAIKILLLELEENIRTIAFSGDWVKLVDSSVQSSTSQIAASAAASTQKRRPGRRGRKPSVTVEVSDSCKDILTDFTWWRGGALSKFISHRGTLPCSMIRKAARQGGLKKISGMHYVEGLDSPRMSRQLVWRSAVEMSQNVAQLALQVRYLDFYVRWSDLVCPEQNLLDGKGPETEVSAFRNAFICGKKMVGHDIRYCVAFRSQKHLPSRVKKNIAEVEQNLNDGMERYWFSETRVPLYLIKEYEGKVEKNKPADVLSKLQMRQRKGFHKNMFCYLWKKQDSTHQSYCCSCQEGVLHRNAFKCSACQGLCHVRCAISSTVTVNERDEFLMTCKKCSESRVITNVQSSYGSPTSPLLLQTQDLPNGGTSSKRGKSAVTCKLPPSPAAATLELSSEKKLTSSSATAKKGKNKHWGVVWKKKIGEDGANFRLKNILHKGNPNKDLIKPPECRLCSQPYNPELMYIRCDTCQAWYHADAVELDESKIADLLGFKCSKCRRIRSPVCPYLDPAKKKALEDKIVSKAPKLDICQTANNSHFLPSHLKEAPTPLSRSIMPEFHHLASEIVPFSDPLAQDHESNNSSTRKLTVRRNIKQDNYSNDYSQYAVDPFLNVEISSPYEASAVNSSEKLPIRRFTKSINPESNDGKGEQEGFLPPQSQWGTSDYDNVDDMITLDYDDCLGFDDTEFEPQTYFSFHELLASDDGGRTDGTESLEISYDQEEPIISVDTTIEVIPCKICKGIDPCPDLSCQVCGIWLHKGCSPWFESSSFEDGWRCGNCREWR